MRIKLLGALILGLCFVSASQAQSVVITKRTITHKRPKARVDHKRSFTINYPVVKTATPAVSQKIRAELDYFKLWKFTLKEELTEIHWLEEADFEVKFNRGGMLSVLMWIEGSGAYPDGSSKYIVIDTKTGRRLKVADLFTSHLEMAATLNSRMQKEIEQEKLRIKNDKETADIDTTALFEGKRFTADSLDQFLVLEKGVSFYYDFGFPHVIEALEPTNEYHLTCAELRPFIKRGGLLATLVR